MTSGSRAGVPGPALTDSVQLTDGIHGYGATILERRAKRGLDVAVSLSLLAVLLPIIALVAAAIWLDSRGPVLYRCRRVGRDGQDFAMLKFRKMRIDATGPVLTLAADERFTRLGGLLAASKLDELPQLWNVLRGDMSLVGPRPESREFVQTCLDDYRVILRVKPGITGLTQLAFVKESQILDVEDRVGHYVRRLLPQKARLDRFYAENWMFRTDVWILCWTVVAVLLRRDVAVNRRTGALGLRRRAAVPAPTEVVAPTEAR
jgi:lipopolysaccharide/colanic/teichoic acid biosynthesis glycosyltransferase